jgi:hypothetical protein
VLDDLGREAVATIAERSHLDILPDTPALRPRFRHNAHATVGTSQQDAAWAYIGTEGGAPTSAHLRLEVVSGKFSKSRRRGWSWYAGDGQSPDPLARMHTMTKRPLHIRTRWGML